MRYLTDYRMEKAVNMLMTGNERPTSLQKKLDMQNLTISAMYLRNSLECLRPNIRQKDWSRSEKNLRICEEKDAVGAGGTGAFFYRCFAVRMGVFGITMYHLFVNRMESMMSESAEQLLDQTAMNLESYLKSMRRISDTMYYSVIKDKDLEEDTMASELGLLYEANKESLVSIACFTGEGDLVDAAPVSKKKTNLDVTKKEWFTEAVGQMENFSFFHAPCAEFV